MSIYAQTDNGQTQIASNKGWSQFGDWAETLDAKTNGAVVSLWEHGVTEDVKSLSAGLQAARTATKPIADVEGIIEGILAACDGVDYLLISNGMGDEDETNGTKAADELPAWTPEELDAMSEEFTEDDLKRALATSSEPLRELLRARGSE